MSQTIEMVLIHDSDDLQNELPIILSLGHEFGWFLRFNNTAWRNPYMPTTEFDPCSEDRGHIPSNYKTRDEAIRAALKYFDELGIYASVVNQNAPLLVH